MRAKRSGGFTLVEILVVIAIIGILVSLVATHLGPAQARARQMQCSNRMSELLVATTNYQQSKGQLPGFAQKYGEFGGGVDPTDPGNFGGNVPPHVKLGTWVVGILSKLDSQNQYEAWTLDRYPIISDGSGEYHATPDGYSRTASPTLAKLLCPSAISSSELHGAINFIANTGFHANAFPFTYTRPSSTPQSVSFQQSMNASNSVFSNRYSGFDPANPGQRVRLGRGGSLDDIKDGLSQTIIYSESNQAMPWFKTRLTGSTSHLRNFQTVGSERVVDYPVESRYLQGMVWHYEDDRPAVGAPSVNSLHKINGGDIAHQRMDASNLTDLARPSSLHQGGVNMGFADGHVTFVADTIDYRVYQALMTPRTRSSEMPMNEYILVSDEL